MSSQQMIRLRSDIDLMLEFLFKKPNEILFATGMDYTVHLIRNKTFEEKKEICFSWKFFFVKYLPTYLPTKTYLFL